MIRGLFFINVEISIYLYKEIAICQRRLGVRKDRRKRGGKDQQVVPSILKSQLIHFYE